MQFLILFAKKTNKNFINHHRLQKNKNISKNMKVPRALRQYFLSVQYFFFLDIMRYTF